MRCLLARGAVAVAALGLAGCGSSTSSTTTWHALRSVRVTVSHPGLPPPGGLPRTTSLTTPAEVARATSALNNFHIVRRAATANLGCAGGSVVEITVVPQSGRTVSLNAYRCVGRTFGDLGGDLAGFLSAVGVPAQ